MFIKRKGTGAILPSNGFLVCLYTIDILALVSGENLSMDGYRRAGYQIS